MRRRFHLGSDTSGAAAAEMALILPLVLTMMFATFEGAWYLVCEHRVIKGVRDAARYAARLDRSQFTCPGNAFTGSTATIQNLARTGKLTGGNAQVPNWVNGDVTVTVSCATAIGGIYNSTGGNAPRVTVRTQFAYPSMMQALGFTQATVQIGAAAQSPVIGL
ncbi:TadE/TadG family type IV pilus assembly protein [Novosphingobium sp.]|uniref:TadE/TadG family type IV pilus assembly protein n=2 Tax=Novosphingobium sp. TaxID=1874826 RepID=UPI00286ADCEA|nr:TadE/TadG family type IV pilus assembly protein [Novosphingobium sp.]